GRDRQEARGQREVVIHLLPAGEQVVAPHRHRPGREHQQRQHRSLVAEKAPPGERRQSLGHAPDEREEHHVHHRVAVEPEQLLVGDVPAVAADEGRVYPADDVDAQREQQRRERGQHHQGRHDHRPSEHRQAEQRHVRRPHAQRRPQGGAAHQDHAAGREEHPGGPQRHPVPLRVRAVGEWRVPPPAELALYSFIILVLTGVFLTFFFHPSEHEIVYHGSYTKLDGISMTEAYQSALNITFDVRGGLLVRQIHHWAALVFVAAIAAHALRIFFTGAFRKPRELNWVIGTTMFILAAVEGFAGYSLPDDLLSGTGLRIAERITLSVPVVGTYLAFFLFGGQYPGDSIVPRLYIAHVLLLPGLILALVTAHLMAVWRQGHSQWPGKKEREDNEVGEPMFPRFIMKTTSLFFFVFGLLALLGAVAQINPIWLFGPYNPAISSNGSQPDWYFAFIE